MRLAGKVAVVTGGGSGIGRGIALCLAREGANVAIPDLQEAGAGSVAREVQALGREAIGLRCDVTREADIRASLDRIRADLGQIDIVVNNAGVASPPGLPFTRNTEEDWDRAFDVNVKSVFLMCKAIAPYFIERRAGRIINIASIAGKEGNPNAAHYSASKAGLIALTKSLGKELAGHEIAVNAVTPAAARTAIFDQMTQQHIDFMLSKIPKGRFVLVEELAAMVAWLASEDCAFSTGAVFDISGGRATY
jgi:NAD(P)-dependent dehydrogenase (short-subunit alcohol dehydrogenase family)